MKIVTLVQNSMAYDIRVRRHAQAMAEAGHEVVSIGVLTSRDREVPRLPDVPGVRFVWADRRPQGSFRGKVGWITSAVLQRACERAWRAGLRSRPVAYRIVSSCFEPLLHTARRHRADVYYANDANTLPVGLTMARRTGAKLVYDAHEFYQGEADRMDPVHVEAIKYVEGEGLARASARITVSRLIGEELAKMFGCPTPRVVRNVPEVIADIEVGDVPEAGRPVRVLYHSANIGLHARHIKDLIDGAAELGGEVFLTLRGHLGPEADQELRAYLAGRLPADSWQVLPPLPYAELMRDASRHDIGVVLNSTTNLNEILTLPNKLFEYMMVGLAVLAYRTPLAAETIEQERIGYVTDVNTPEALARGLRALVADRAELRRMKQRSRDRALEAHNWSEEKRRLLEIIGGLEPSARAK